MWSVVMLGNEPTIFEGDFLVVAGGLMEMRRVDSRHFLETKTKEKRECGSLICIRTHARSFVSSRAIEMTVFHSTIGLVELFSTWNHLEVRFLLIVRKKVQKIHLETVLDVHGRNLAVQRTFRKREKSVEGVWLLPSYGQP